MAKKKAPKETPSAREPLAKVERKNHFYCVDCTGYFSIDPKADQESYGKTEDEMKEILKNGCFLRCPPCAKSKIIVTIDTGDQGTESEE